MHFDFIFTNWRHHKSNLVLPTPRKNKVVEEPIKKLIPEIDITQQQQNEQEKEVILCAEKGLEPTKKELLIPLSKNQKKIMRW